MEKRTSGKNKLKNSQNDLVIFLSQWMSSPSITGAVMPSGKDLAQAITKNLSKDMKIIEIGPGNGIFTSYIVKKGIAQDQITLMEINPVFCSLLKERFPGARIFESSASKIKLLAPGEKFDACICGIPFLSIPKREMWKIVIAIFHVLNNGSALYLFTYGTRCPLPKYLMKRLNLKAKHISFVAKNIPPANIYEIKKN